MGMAGRTKAVGNSSTLDAAAPSSAAAAITLVTADSKTAPRLI
jgi:hypothetical protein